MSVAERLGRWPWSVAAPRVVRRYQLRTGSAGRSLLTNAFEGCGVSLPAIEINLSGIFDQLDRGVVVVADLAGRRADDERIVRNHRLLRDQGAGADNAVGADLRAV